MGATKAVWYEEPKAVHCLQPLEMLIPRMLGSALTGRYPGKVWLASPFRGGPRGRLRGQEPYHQGALCPELKKRGWVLEAFVLRPNPDPGCSLFRAVARWGIGAPASGPPVCSEGLRQKEMTREGDPVSHPPWGLSLASRFCFPSH